jgi:uncharacterized protein (TIGR00369 family)
MSTVTPLSEIPRATQPSVAIPELLEYLRSHSGLEFLQAVADGELPPPPIGRLLEIEPVEFAPGRAVWAATPDERHVSLIGTVHGGYSALLLDSALGCAVHTRLPAGTGYATLELSVNYIRPIVPSTGRIICEADAIHVGRTTATAEARLTRERDGKLLAHAKTTIAVMREPAAA